MPPILRRPLLLAALALVFATPAQAARTLPVGASEQYLTSLARAVPYVKDSIVGNEPTLNRFWLPQSDRRGRDVAAAAYDQLLAQSYDALKAVDPSIDVIGGAVSPRGADRARAA